jgi:type III restriction enzyme
MTLFTLKTYQQQALASLGRFLRRADELASLAAAWRQEMDFQQQPPAIAALPYRTQPFGAHCPCVCLRIPTGGGKTLLASHAIALIARTWRRADYPVALWLVPSSTIRDQTLQALQRPGHPYRAALEAAYGQQLLVLDLDAAETLAAQDFGSKAIVLVATIQSFRVRQTQGRNVYAFNEAFDTDFRRFADRIDAGAAALEKVTQADLDDEGQTFLTPADLGRVKHSLANLLALARPIVVVDEAHNAKTNTTFETLKRVAPSAILELTATPVPRKTNVLYSVTARELQAEDMIKLPVMLAEHRIWPDAVRDAVLRRRQLEAEAAHEVEYLRPIVLFQAHDRSGEVPPEALRQHLMDEHHAGPEEIVIATGDQRGLDGVDLFSRGCRVNYVITVEALKEGWDCSFAYVLCSLQNVRSGKDVEQLLGRVLRMPYAKRRRSALLNRAYAHVVARSFSEAAAALMDRMIEGMGFEALDAPTVLLPDPGTPDLFSGEPTPEREPVITIELPAAAAEALRDDPGIELAAAAGAEAGTLMRVSMKGEVTETQAARLVEAALPQVRAEVARQVQQHNERIRAARSPALRGVPFAPLPRLCLQWQGELQLFEREILGEVVAFDLLRADPRPELPGFVMAEQSDLFSIDITAKSRMELRQAQEAQLSLDAVPATASEDDLLRQLVADVRRDSLSPAQLRAWLARLLPNVLHASGASLTGLVRNRHALAQAAMRRLDTLEAQARKQGFDRLLRLGPAAQASLEGIELATAPESSAWQFRFEPGRYPARNAYSGRWRFAKHFFESIHQLKSEGEEFECAKAIDALPEVKHWVRNIERQPEFAFWLPTATDYFYPDFVAELKDGRLLVIEYKGEAYATNDDSREKNAVGRAWAAAGGRRCLFAMVEKSFQGMDPTQQLRHAIDGA